MMDNGPSKERPMPAESRSLKELFLVALAVAPAERSAWLDRECGRDAERRRHVELMLAAHDTPQSLLDRLAPAAPPPEPATGHFAAAAAEGPPGDRREGAGTVVAGRYKLVEQIGEGGMGTVWMAQQTEPVRRLVAVKLIKPGMDSRQVLARFEAERQALALMEHPNIARVLDGGTTENGRPFFVMELVKGVPLTKYCDEHRLTPRQRLELFVPVCQAIQHAHQKGVIHRDVKPSNVLVAAYDGRPVPKVIDFGVAKAAGQQLTEHTLVTGFGAVVGTLEYMSPEQAEVNQLDIDTRSDIYSLGVLLYELLTGTTPLERKRLKDTGLLEALRLIREEEPPRPSTRLSTTEQLPSIAANRGVETNKLSGLVRGELDWIVMKALEKDRSRRYETANGLARDIERYLHDEPVQACPPSASYRLRKLLRRHRAAVLTAAALAALLMAGATISTWQAIRATWAEQTMRTALGETEQAKGRAENARAESEEAQRQAEAVTEYLVKLFRSSDPRVDGRDVKVADLLDRALEDLDAKFADSPKLRGDLLATLGKTYQGLRLYAIAAGLFEKALALRQVTLGADHPDTLDLMAELAHAYRGAGRTDEGIQLAKKTLMLQRAKLGADHPDTLFTVSILGDAYREALRPDEAIRLLEPSLRLCKSKLGSGDEVTLDTMNNLGLAYRCAGRLPEAVAMLRETLDSMKAKLPADDLETLNTTNNLAEALVASERPALAIPMLEESLPRCKTKLGPGHPITVTCGYNLAVAYATTDQPAKAEPLLAQLAVSMRQQRGKESVVLAEALAWLGRNHLLQKKYTEAEPILRECLAIRAKTMPDSWLFFNTKSMLGGSLLGQKKYADAEPLLLASYEGMIQRADTIPAPGKPRLTETLQRLVQLYEATGEVDKVDKWRRKWEEAKLPTKSTAKP
jgi:serine/threonine protein kinase/tetratricopeptide (TPR) repeat protein